MAAPGVASNLAPKDAPSAASIPEKAGYPLPPASVMKLPPSLTKTAAASPSNASAKDYVVAPQRGTLAAGKWEAKPSTIWIVVAVGALMLLGWALLRVRRANAAKKKQLENLTTLRRSSPSS